MTRPLEIRSLLPGDPELLAAAFDAVGWDKSEEQYRHYLTEQQAGVRSVFVALIGGEIAGYVTLNRRPTYLPFVEAGVPEVQDLNVLPDFQRRGIGARLLECAEEEAARESPRVGLGVGLHTGYGAAQRLYVRAGYLPDGRGAAYRDRIVAEGERVPVDDDLVLHLIKQLRSLETDRTERHPDPEVDD